MSSSPPATHPNLLAADQTIPPTMVPIEELPAIAKQLSRVKLEETLIMAMGFYPNVANMLVDAYREQLDDQAFQQLEALLEDIIRGLQHHDAQDAAHVVDAAWTIANKVQQQTSLRVKMKALFCLMRLVGEVLGAGSGLLSAVGKDVGQGDTGRSDPISAAMGHLIKVKMTAEEREYLIKEDGVHNTEFHEQIGKLRREVRNISVEMNRIVFAGLTDVVEASRGIQER